MLQRNNAKKAAGGDGQLSGRGTPDNPVLKPSSASKCKILKLKISLNASLHGANLAALFLGDLTQIKSILSKRNSKCSSFLHPEEFTALTRFKKKN